MSKVCTKVFLLLFQVFLTFHFTASDHNNMEGQICTTNGDQCRQLKNCSYFNYEDIKKGLFRPPVCGFNGSEPIVCCTKNFNKMFGFGRKTKSAEMCEKYEHQICTGYKRTKKDYNSGEVRNLPFMALIGYGPSNNISWKCSGSIVSSRYVLTAAQCSNDITLRSSIWVIVGDIEDDSKSQKFEIVSRFIHPEHKNQSLNDDIAIYRLNKDMQFNEYVRPICLHPYVSILTHRTVLVVGSEYSGDPKHPNVVEIQLNLLPISSCNTSLYRDKLSGGLNKRGMICAEKIQDGREECPDDYGGPVYLPPNRGQLQDGCFLYTQVALTITPFDCGKRIIPGIYTNIGNYIQWIESLIWADDSSNDSSTIVWV